MPVVFKNKNYENLEDQYDSGENTGTSIKPVNNSESVSEDTFRRPSENLRLRTEELKRNIRKYETILQSAGFLSYSYNEAVQPSTVRDSTVEIEWVAADAAFYVRPSTDSVLTILGAVVPGMKYAIDRSAFDSFYGSNVPAGNNPKLGLQNPGDSISFRLPMLSAADAASNPLALIGANTSNPSIDSAVFDTTLYDLVSDPISGASGDSAIFKSPSKYKVKITLSNDANGDALRDALAGASAAGNSISLQNAPDSYSLDASTYLENPENSLEVFLLDPNRSYFPIETMSSDDFKLRVGNTDYDGTYWATAESLVEGAPPEEFLIPIASYTGSKIIVHGIGSVDADDVKNASGSIITLSNTGVSSIELGGAIESYESTFRLSDTILNASDIKNDLETSGDLTLLNIPISLDIPEIATGREYYLESVEIYSKDTGVSDKPVSLTFVSALKSKHEVTGANNLATDIIGRNLLAALVGSVESTDLVDNPSTLRLGYFHSIETRIYSSTNTSTGNLVIRTEEDRERSFLNIKLGVNSNAYTVLSASFDLFFRLTFKTVHGTELPLLASYVPSSP